MKIEDFKQLDYYALEEYGLAIELMMEHAGLQLANVIAKHCEKTDRILIGVGNGNNGGGGLVAARRLAAWGYDVALDIWTTISKTLPLKQLERALAFGAKRQSEEKADVWVDAYLGFSQRLPLPEQLENRIIEAKKFGGLAISLDIPTGFNEGEANSGFPAKIVVTLAAPKEEFKSLQKARIYVADLGIPNKAYKSFGKEMLPFEGNSLIELQSDVYMHEHVKYVRQMHKSSLKELYKTQSLGAFLLRYADELYEAHKLRDYSFVVECSNYYKPLIGRSASEIFQSDLGQEDFLKIAAAVHGFEDITSISEVEIDKDFEIAVDTLLDGDYFGLKEILEDKPELVNQGSHFGHRAQLIHYCASNAIELYRQFVPLNLAAMLSLLLEYGADPQSEIPVYGGAYDFFQLFTSSAHPYDAGINKSIEEAFNF